MKQEAAVAATAVPPHVKISLILLAGMCSLPFLIPHHLNPIPSFANEWLAVTLGLMATAPLMLASRSWQPLHIPSIVLMPLALALLAAVQVATGKFVYWQHHMLVVLYLTWAALMMLLGGVLKREVGVMGTVVVLAWGLLSGGLISALVTGLQLAGMEFALIMTPNGRSFSANLGQTNHLAQLLGLSIASMAYLGYTQRLPRWTLPLLSFALVTALALTGSRSAWLYLGVLLVMGFFIKRRQPNAQSRALMQLTVALLVFFTVLQFTLPLFFANNSPAMATERIIAAAGDHSVRLQLLDVAWRAFLTSPWIGVGFGQFAWHDFLLAEAVPHTAGMATHAHNLFGNMLAETGLVGTAILLAGLGFWLFNFRGRTLTAERWWMYAMLGMLFTHSMLEYPLWYAYFLGLGALLLGLGDEKGWELRMELGPVLVAGLLAFGAFSLHNIAVNERKLESWFALGNLGKIGTQQSKAFATDMAEIRNRSLLAPYADAASAILMQTDSQDIQEKLQVSSHALRQVPTATLTYKHAALLALSGKRTDALNQLYLALSRHPGMADVFYRHLFRQLVKGEIRLLPLMMVIQETTQTYSKLKLINSGSNPAPIREIAP